MASLVFIKGCLILCLASFNFVPCNLNSHPRESDRDTCDSKGDSCAKGNNPRDTEEIDGPTIIGRDGLTRLDGIKVSHFPPSFRGLLNTNS